MAILPNKLSPLRESTWPDLASEGYKVTSEETPRNRRQPIPYNCIAFAAGIKNEWWWPDLGGFAVWPIARREETLDCFVEAYQTEGFQVCRDGNLQTGVEKIAIYTLNGVPTHAARQLPDGRWTSKLGSWEDIEHNTVKAVEDTNCYGKVVQYMKRPIK